MLTTQPNFPLVALEHVQLFRPALLLRYPRTVRLHPDSQTIAWHPTS